MNRLLKENIIFYIISIVKKKKSIPNLQKMSLNELTAPIQSVMDSLWPHLTEATTFPADVCLISKSQ